MKSIKQFPPKWICRFLVRRFSKNSGIGLRVIVGAATDRHQGWISSDIPKDNIKLDKQLKLIKNGKVPLNIAKEADWDRLFSQGSIDNILSEHVLEHLSDDELLAVASNFYSYLKPGGNARIAVPDGNRPDKKYIDYVSPPNDGHLQLFTIESISKIFENVGFNVIPIEYYNEQEQFIHNPYNEELGVIRRCLKHDKRKEFRLNNHHYTSIIIDIKKPA